VIVTVPLKLPALAGVNRNSTDWLPPGAMDPDVGLAVECVVNPPVAVMPVKDRAAVPVLEIVIVASLLDPTTTSPNARDPEMAIILVAATVGAGDGDVGELLPPPPPPQAESTREATTDRQADRRARRSIMIGGSPNLLDGQGSRNSHVDLHASTPCLT